MRVIRAVLEEGMGGVFDEDELRGTVICFRATPSLEGSLESAMDRENAAQKAKGKRPMSRSRFASRCVDLGLALYATLEHERARFDDACRANGWTWEEGVRAVFDRGLTALQGPPHKRR